MHRFLSHRPTVVACVVAPLALGVVVLLSGGLRAQTGTAPPASTTAPAAPAPTAAADDEEELVDGQAERWDEDEKTGVTLLTGNVRIERETGYLYADKVTFYRNMAAQEREVDRTLAEGNVRLKDGDIVATCDVAEFREGNNVIDLQGEKGSPVVVVQENDRLEATRFVYDRRTGRRTATGGVKFQVRLRRTTAEGAAGTGAPEASPEPASQPPPQETTDGR
jgi:lipopolysaccharide transport protein LptA